MRLLLTLVLALVLGLLVFLWFGRSRPQLDHAPVPSTTSTNDPDLTTSHSEELSPTDTQPSARVQPSSTDSSPTPSAPAGPRCRIFGRVIDERGAPIEHVDVSTYPVGGRWSDVASIPKIGAPGREHESLSTHTAADGRFEFEAPLPTSDWIALAVEPDRYFALADRHFGPAGGRDKPRLVEGDNDLGDIQLADCGAITGRVLASNGRPIPHASAAVPAANSVDRQVNAGTDDEGRFIAGHISPGHKKLDVTAEGWITRRDIAITTQARVTTNVPDIVLEPAFVISGTVVDEDGKPVFRATLWGSQRPGMRKIGRVHDDGTFVIYLDTNDACTLEVRNAQGFDPWGGTDEAKYPVGTTDVRIVLHRSAGFTFRVIDANTQQPIERFGLRLGAKPVRGSFNSADERAIPLEDHAGGEVHLPLSYSWVVVSAPGHATLETDVTADAGSKDIQTIALRASSSVIGRILLSDAPVQGASVSLWRDGIDKDPTNTKRKIIYEPGLMSGGMTFDVGAYAGRKHTARSMIDGRFNVSDLTPGTWMMRIDVPGAAQRTVHELLVPPESALDLGDVRLDPGCTIRGVLVTEAGVSPKGFTVELDQSMKRGARSIRTGRHLEIDNIDGKFEFTGLEAGAHDLTWGRPTQNSWSNDDPHEQSLELAAGETREVIIDASGSAPCTVIVHLTRAGGPAEGLSVFVSVRSRLALGGSRGWRLGRSGPDGTVEGQIDGDLVFDLEVHSPNEKPIGYVFVSTAAVPGGRIEVTYEIKAGRVVVELPATLEIPQPGLVLLSLQAAGAELQTTYATSGGLDGYRHAVPWTSRTIEFGEFAVGEYEATITVQRFEADATQPRGRKTVDMREPFKTKVKIEADREVKIVVP